MNYEVSTGARRKFSKIIIIALIVFIVGIIGTVLVIRHNYEENLRPISASQRSLQVTIPSGSSVKEIATQLEELELIRSAWAFEWYIRTNDLRESLLAGTYSLRPNQSIPDIVDILTQGKIATDLVTILPGQRIDQIKQALQNYEFTEEDVENALDPALYDDHPALVDKPVGANLEGYLYPESFQRTAETDPETIIRASLDEMQKHLTPDLRAGIVRQGLTVHQGIILASIIEQEVSNPDDKPTVAQVFLRRLKEGTALESDATAPYGAVLAGKASSLSRTELLTYNSPYNTYNHKGLPPTPISNVSKSSLEAVARPSNTDYLFFVSGDDGKTYFSNTIEQHEAFIEQHCTSLCGR